MLRALAAAAVALALGAALLAAVPAPAEAATRAVCARQAVLRDSPRGFVVAYLRRGTRVTLVRRSPDRRWSAVRLRTGLTGWARSSALCRR